MNTPIILETYRDTEIAFQSQDSWVNATQMAKAFNKRVNNFLRADRTIEYIAALEKSVARKSVTVIQGGSATEQGTWMHPDLAMEFARWLSPEFSIWCNRVIRRILSGQSVEVKKSDIDALCQGFASLAKSVELLTQAYATQAKSAELLTQAYAAQAEQLRKVNATQEWCYLQTAELAAIVKPGDIHVAQGVDHLEVELERAMLAALGEAPSVTINAKHLLEIARKHGLLVDLLSQTLPHGSLGRHLAKRSGRRIGSVILQAKGRHRHRRYILTRA